MDTLFEREIIALRPWAMKFAKSLAFGNVHEAEDIVQDAMLSAVRNQHGFKGESSIRTYLARVLINMRTIRHRKRQGRGANPREVFLEDIDHTNARLTYNEQGFDQVDIAATMEHLSEDERELLFAGHAHGASYMEIAGKRGCHRNTVANRRDHLIASLDLGLAA